MDIRGSRKLGITYHGAINYGAILQVYIAEKDKRVGS